MLQYRRASAPGCFSVGDRLLFGDGDGRLWASDGTDATTSVIPLPDRRFRDTIDRLGDGRYLFRATQLDTGVSMVDNEVGITDGTAAGTDPLQAADGSALVNARATGFAVDGRIAFFTDQGQALWWSKRTLALSTPQPGERLLDPRELADRPNVSVFGFETRRSRTKQRCVSLVHQRCVFRWHKPCFPSGRSCHDLSRMEALGHDHQLVSAMPHCDTHTLEVA